MHSLSYINGLHKISSSNSMSAPGGQNPSALLSFIVSTYELMYIKILGDQNVYFGTSDASQKWTLFSLLLSLSPSFHLLLRLKGFREFMWLVITAACTTSPADSVLLQLIKYSLSSTLCLVAPGWAQSAPVLMVRKIAKMCWSHPHALCTMRQE